MKYLILLVLFALAACADAPATVNYTLTPPANPGGRMCTIQCRQAEDYCKESCGLENRQCILDVQSQAMRDYDRYTVEQFSSHQPVELRVSDFERTTRCDSVKSTCESRCDSRHRSCYSDCGGTVTESSSCQLFCF